MARFVGRRRELAELKAALEAVTRGEGGLFLIGGEPGIGKTRLVERALEDAAPEAAAVWGRCVELEGAPPYWPWLQVLRSVAVFDPAAVELRESPDAAAAMARLLPELRRGRSSRTLPAESDQRFVLFEAVAQVLRSAALSRPLVTVLDDLQWADADSLALLRHLARELHGLKLLVIATYRDVDVGRRGPLAAILPELVRERGARSLRLGGLEQVDVAEYLAAVRHGERDPAVARVVHDRAGGNPFYIAEICRLASESSEIQIGGVPLGIRQVVGRRLDRLSEECQQMLGAASVLGREFDVELLAELLQTKQAALLPWCDEAEAAAVLVRRAPRSFAFAHDLVRECLYEDLPTPRRLRLHRQTAEILEESEPSGSLPVLAHHWYEAGGEASWEKAVDYAARAAAAALEQAAYEDAARLLTMALDSLPSTSGGERRWALLHELSVAQYRAGMIRDSLRSCAAAARLANELQRGDLEARSVLVIQDVADASVHPALQALCESALASLGDREPALRAQLLAQLARILDTIGRPERNDALSREAIELADRSGDAEALIAAIYARHTVASLPEGIDERRSLGARLIEIGGAGGGLAHAAWGRLWRIDADLQAGDLPAVEHELADLAVAADRLRQPLFSWHLLRTRAALGQATGRFDEALRLNDEALAAWDPGRHGMTGVFHRWVEGTIGIELGSPELVERAVSLHDMVQPPMRPSFAAVAARMELALGHGDRALDLLDDAVRWVFSSAPGRQTMLVTALLSEVAVSVGTREQQQRLREALGPYRGVFIASGAGAVACFGSVARVIGVLDAALGRWEDAATALEEAVTANQRAGAVPYAAHAQLHLARVNAQQRHAEAARELARAAVRTALRLKMKPLQADAERLLKDLERALPRLSERESEIASLVARGQSNRAIAESTHLSVRTVENHVQRILDKLGFTSRAQIAAWAVANGLISRQDIATAP